MFVSSLSACRWREECHAPVPQRIQLLYYQSPRVVPVAKRAAVDTAVRSCVSLSGSREGRPSCGRERDLEGKQSGRGIRRATTESNGAAHHPEKLLQSNAPDVFHQRTQAARRAPAIPMGSGCREDALSRWLSSPAV